MPDRGSNCGLPPPLSVNCTFPLRLPSAPGVKVTITVQVAPGASEAGQLLLVIAKSLALVPVVVTFVIFKLPVGATFLTVMVFG